jgi:hypothetical protein
VWRVLAGHGTLVGVVAVVFSDILAFGAVFAGCIGCLWLANRIEPHWVSRDGRRFLTVAQELDQWGLPAGRRREVRVRIDAEADALLITRRSLVRPSQTLWMVDGKVPDPPRKRAIYLLKEVSSTDLNRLAVRLPADSKVIPSLEKLLAATGSEAVQARELARLREDRARPADDGTDEDSAPSSTAVSDAPGSPPPDPPADRG